MIGGMYYHIGYLNKLNHTSLGLGGKISYRIHNNIRIGLEGYNSKAIYNKDGSFYSLGWGGLLIECIYPINNLRFFSGISIGGGNNKHLKILSNNNNNPKTVYWNKDAVFILNPYLGMEYSLTKKINFSSKIDYILSPSQDLYYKGIRLYIGFLFNMK